MQTPDMIPVNTARVPVVFDRDGQVFADSRDVAAYFGKRHDDVLKATRNLIANEPSLGDRNFAAFKINDLTGESTSHYEMDRDGFTLLAMGFTGSKALKFKLQYIQAFNVMEAELQQRANKPVDYSDPSVVVGVITSLQQQVVDKQALIEQQGQRLTTLDRLEGADGSMCMSDAAKTLGVRRKDLIGMMSARRWIFKRPGNKNWLAYDSARKAGLMEHDEHLYMDSLGQERVATRALVTAKGLVRLAEILEEKPH